MSARINGLYYGGCGHGHHLELKAGEGFLKLPAWLDITGLVETALARVFEARMPDVDPDLFEITFAALDDAVDRGFGRIKYGEPDFEMSERLRDSAAVFAARKTVEQTQELAKLLVRANGETRPWEEFRELAKPIVKDYNEIWLETEYNTGIRKARSAKDWQQYSEDIDLYPNLKYLPSRAATPREQHKKFYGVIKPVIDPFWTTHYPPIDWLCLCGVEQTDDEVTEPSQDTPMPSDGLDNNPGITGKLFSDSHPYNNKDLSKNEREAIDQKGRDYAAKRRKGNSQPN